MWRPPSQASYRSAAVQPRAAITERRTRGEKEEFHTMGVLDRVSTLIRANINDLISRAEDPEKVIRQLLLDMNNQLIQVKTQVAAAIADERLLQKRYEDNQKKADEWQRKAELAVERGQDDLAKEALSRKRTFQETADGFKQQWADQAAQVEQLKEALG